MDNLCAMDRKLISAPGPILVLRPLQIVKIIGGTLLR